MHSPRRGGTTEALLSNVPDFIIDIQGRWKSESSKFRYATPTAKEICAKLAGAPSY